MELYRWQKQCLNAWEESGRRGIVRAVTGAGKTMLALATIDRMRQRFPEVRVKLVVPTVALAQQWKTALLHNAPEEIWRPGLFGGGLRDDPERRVMIYILNSARDSLAGHIRRELSLRRHVLLICDECHHCQSPQNRRIFDFLTPEALAGGLYASLGLSATPFGTGDDEILTRGLGPEIYRYDFEDASREGVVSAFNICEVSAPFSADEGERYAQLTLELFQLLQALRKAYPSLEGLPRERFLRMVSALAQRAGMDPADPAAAFLLKSYERKEISVLASARIRCALALLERLAPENRVLAFCERIEQARKFAAAVRRSMGNVCGLYHSQMSAPARERCMEDFRRRRSRILIACRCLDEGIDVPEANIGIVLSGSAVERQRIQRLGRLIRNAPGKDGACLYYIYIRDSADDAAFLPNLNGRNCFALRYYPAEDCFSHDTYEYAAADLLERSRQRGFSPAQLRELRRCLNEGLARSDFLLSPEALRRRGAAAESVHEKNYWRAMSGLGRAFRAPEP